MSNNSKRYIIGVDFDGTLCELKPFPEIGKPNLGLINYLKHIRENSDTNAVILWTNRTGKALDEAVEWCKGYGLEFDAVNDNIPEIKEWWKRVSSDPEPRKIITTTFIDDKNDMTWNHLPYIANNEDEK